MIHATRLHRFAVLSLAIFVAMVCVTAVAPLLRSVSYEALCSITGTKFVAVDDVVPSSHDDHAAHCPLCMPAGAPPAAIVFRFEPSQPLAHVLRSIPAARLASLVGAPLPARGPPSFA